MKSVLVYEKEEIASQNQLELAVENYFEERVFPDPLLFLRGFTWGIIFSIPLWVLIIISLMKIYG